MRIIVTVFIIACLINSIAFALECYVCDEQEENNDKCSKTVKQCNETEDTCAAYIFWTSPIEMTPRGERRFFLTKTCETQANCQKMMYAFTPICSRNWYDDWSCVECCKGDRCNKYVVLGATSLPISLKLILIFILLSINFFIFYI